MSLPIHVSEKRADRRLRADITTSGIFDNGHQSSPTTPVRSRSSRTGSDSPSEKPSGALPLLSRLPGPSDVFRRRLPHSISALMTPRFIVSLVAWCLGLYLMYEYLLPAEPYNPLSETMDDSSPHLVEEPVFLNTARLNSTSVPAREGNDNLDSIDTRWRPFSPLKPKASFPTLRPTRFLPDHCMEQFFLEGETNCKAEELGPEERLDAVWFWVNGTDPRWIDSLADWKNRTGIESPEKHYRENNELLYSVRSVMASLPGKIENAHIVTADYPFKVPEDLELLDESVVPKLEEVARSSQARRSAGATEVSTKRAFNTRAGTTISDTLAQHLSTHWRVAQTPTWLDFSHRDLASPFHPFAEASRFSRVDYRGPLSYAELNYPNLLYVPHSEIFHLPTSSKAGLKPDDVLEYEADDERFREEALPTFNSMALESRVGWVPGLSRIAITLNDDFFVMRRQAVSDFYSPFYGTVIRLDMSYGMQVQRKIDPDLFTEAGENGGLFHANWILSERFPKRLRHYASHVPKVIPREINHEVGLMFRDALNVSGRKKFREVALGNGDVQSLWLTMYFQVERWREALLWTYLVARLGHATNGILGDDARNELQKLLGIDQDFASSQVLVRKGNRATLQKDRVQDHFKRAGWEEPKATQMLFSSMDGYLPTLNKPGTRVNPNLQCTIDLPQCFGTFWTEQAEIPAVELFKHLTFDQWECGDCLINALVTASGPLGLSAIFSESGTNYNVPSDQGYVYEDGTAPPPHLPVTPTWQEADFSLESVLGQSAKPGETVELRLWCMKLLSRYLFISGRSNVRFHQLMNEDNTRGTLRTLDLSRAVSFLGLNDDIESNYDRVRQMLGDWMQNKWPKKAVWERGWKREIDWVKGEGGTKEEFVGW